MKEDDKKNSESNNNNNAYNEAEKKDKDSENEISTGFGMLNNIGQKKETVIVNTSNNINTLTDKKPNAFERFGNQRKNDSNDNKKGGFSQFDHGGNKKTEAASSGGFENLLSIFVKNELEGRNDDADNNDYETTEGHATSTLTNKGMMFNQTIGAPVTNQSTSSNVMGIMF